MVQFLMRLLGPREPQCGEVWKVRNEDLGIPFDGSHPVLVVGGSSFKNGPVLIAPGSSSFPPTQDEIALVVEPEDCDPRTGLERHTRFRLTSARRLAREALRVHVCKIGEAKQLELLMLRSRIL